MWSGVAVQREEMATGGDPRTRDLLGSCWHWSERAGLDLETSPLWGDRLDAKAEFNFVSFPRKSSGIGIQGTKDGEDGDDVCLDQLGIVRFGMKRKGGGLFQDLNFPQSVRWSGGHPPAEQNLVGALGSAAAEELGAEERGLRLDLHIPSGRVGGCEWQSVCTLDKVKNALRRAEAESAKRKASDPCCSTVSAQRSADGSPSRGSSSPAIHSSGGADGRATALLATGCPRCLLYVLLPKTDPKCPRCGFLIAADSTEPNKRPRLFGFDDDRFKPAANPAASGTRTPDVDHLFDLNTVSF